MRTQRDTSATNQLHGFETEMRGVYLLYYCLFLLIGYYFAVADETKEAEELVPLYAFSLHAPYIGKS